LKRLICIACTFTIAVVATAIFNGGAFAGEQAKVACRSTQDPTTGDAVEFDYNDREKTLLIKVHYRRGIGGAKVTWTKKTQPRKIVLELQNFRNLEALSMTSGGNRFQTSLKVAPMIWGKSAADENEHELKPRVGICAKADKIMAAIPADAYAWNVMEVLVGWIDAYR
jgi:hypothetical protein